ncbi:hypothetical protein ACJIZ3_019704 [Penstemon smallii]|uniref:GH10 domain-containing protein n=1 Tax=Penstemon smallii TaxID=265156 RepID=A0ABD3T3G3_9LAMI
MKVCVMSTMFVIVFSSLLLTGCASAVGDESYDYSASIECLDEPLASQYGGGLVINPGFDLGLNGWTAFGQGKIALRFSRTGNKFIVAYNRSQPSDSITQVVSLGKELLYTFSAWVQIGDGKANVSALLKTSNNAQLITVGSVIAKFGCWSMLKGGFTLDQDTVAQLFFRVRAQITINQIKPRFHIGCGSTETIINTKAYQDWFTPRFTATTFDNEMKWYYIEKERGKENYTIPDAMVSFFEKNGIAIRGHTIHWDSYTVIQQWVKNLSLGDTSIPNRETLNVAVKRIRSVVSRYIGKVNGWDVVNENLHNSFFEDKIGPNASAMFYQLTRQLDPYTPLFLNEYSTLEYATDLKVIPSRFVEKIRETRSYPGNENLNLGIGLQGHFIERPILSYIRSVLDVLGATKIPIWLTELDTKKGPQQATQLEDVMREAFAHPAVEGIIVWAGWKPTTCSEACLTNMNKTLPKGCSELCLTDNNFKNLPTGDVVDKLLKEWRTTNVNGVSDNNGLFESNVFHGGYSVAVSHPQISGIVKLNITVTNDKPGPLEVLVSL